MGDYWLFEDRGELHQFYLERDLDGPFDRIGRATSTDMLRWRECEEIRLGSGEGDWDRPENGLRTGFTLRHQDRYWTAYGAMDGGVEKIGWLVSDDLDSWQRVGSGPVMGPQLPWYEHRPEETIEFGCFWRDPHLIHRGGAWEAFVCARDAGGAHGGRGCIGRARSEDLLAWTYLPPIFAPGAFRGMEVPHYFALGGRHYFLWSTMSRKGIRLNSAKGQLGAGVYYCLADDFEGPYRLPEDPLLLGESSYVGRHVAFGGDDLFVHLNQREYDEEADRPSFGLPKRLGHNPDGSLSLHFWPPAASLWRDADPPTPTGPLEPWGLPGEWSVSDDTITGVSAFGPSAVWTRLSGGDLHLGCDLSLSPGCRGSVLLRGHGVRGEDTGLIFTVNDAERQFEIGSAGGVRSGLYLKLDQILPFDALPELAASLARRRYPLRLIARSEIVEAYLQDRLIFSRSFASLPAAGRIGFAADGGRLAIERLSVHPLERTREA